MSLPPFQQQGEYALDHNVQTQVIPIIVHQHISDKSPDLVTLDRFESKYSVDFLGDKDMETDLKEKITERWFKLILHCSNKTNSFGIFVYEN